MEDWLQTLQGLLPEGRLYYLLVGGVALLESIAGIGLVVPGSVFIVFTGFLAFHGQGNFFLLAGSVATGACLGDLLSYVLGARVGAAIIHSAPFRRRHHVLHKAEAFFAGHGGKSVFFGRFLGPLRGFIPFVAGCTRMGPLAFLGYTLLSCVLWGLTYPGLGYIGGASWQRVRILTGRFGLVLFLLLLLFVLNGLFWEKAAPRLGGRLSRLWERLLDAWGRFLQTPFVAGAMARHPRLWNVLAKRFSLHSGTGLYLTVGFLVSTLFASLFVWLAIDLPAIRSFDWRVHDFFRALRHPAADTLMVAAAALADGPSFLLLAGYILLALLLHNRDFSALVLVVGLGGGELLIYLLHLLFQRPGPDPFLLPRSRIFTGFPSGHAFSTYLLCGLAVYFLLGTVAEWKSRRTLIIAGSFLALLIGFSRIYLGLQWVSSVLAGYALAALWLTFLITAAEMRRRYAGEFPWREGWQPPRLATSLRIAILAVAGLLVAATLASYLSRQLGLL